MPEPETEPSYPALQIYRGYSIFMLRGPRVKTKTKLILALAGALACSSCTQFFAGFASMVIRTVTFEENGGSQVVDQRTSLISAMPISSKPGYALEGWYTDATFAAGTKASFPYDPLADLTLYAKWIPASAGLSYTANDSGYTVWYDSGSGDLIVPSHWLGKPVTSIGSWAFSGSYGVTSIAIPSTVKEIGAGAFSSCDGLTSITIPESVTSLGESVLAWCGNLTSVALPSAIAEIPATAFKDCAKLTGVAIPAGVTKISSSAFSGCSALAAVAFPSGLTYLGAGAFESCSLLTAAAIPSSLGYLGASAFKGSALTSVEIPSAVSYIGGSAFKDCAGLLTVRADPLVPPTTDAHIFDGCGALTSIAVPLASLAAYQSAFGWSAYSAKISALP
jgi:uncharacterized repeat protein (TIGR02543 family)